MGTVAVAVGSAVAPVDRVKPRGNTPTKFRMRSVNTSINELDTHSRTIARTGK